MFGRIIQPCLPYLTGPSSAADGIYAHGPAPPLHRHLGLRRNREARKRRTKPKAAPPIVLFKHTKQVFP